MLLRDFILLGNKFLNESRIPNPTFDIKSISAFFLKIKFSELFFYYQTDLTERQVTKLLTLVQLRCKGEPVSKIFHKKTFWDYEFYVDNRVLDPRPDSEFFIEACIEDYNTKDHLNILDLGTGSGCLIISLIKIFSNAFGYGLDISSPALNIAKHNALKNLVADRIKFIESNWTASLSCEKFDIIVSNPPYIPAKNIDLLSKDVKNYDPVLALNGGEEGLDAYKQLADLLLKNCKEHTNIYLEIGNDQEEAVRNIFQKNYIFIKGLKDLSNVRRILNFRPRV